MDFNLEQFITTGENGQIIDVEGAKAAIQQEIDSKVSKGVDKGVENYRKKQAAANDQQNAEFVKQIEDLTLRYNKSECKSILAGDLFTDKERELLLDSLVSQDLVKSQDVLNSLVKERKALDEARTQKIIEGLQAGQPDVKNPPANGEQGGGKQKTTKTFQQRSQEIKDFYK